MSDNSIESFRRERRKRREIPHDTFLKPDADQAGGAADLAVPGQVPVTSQDSSSINQEAIINHNNNQVVNQNNNDNQVVNHDIKTNQIVNQEDSDEDSFEAIATAVAEAESGPNKLKGFYLDPQVYARIHQMKYEKGKGAPSRLVNKLLRAYFKLDK